MISGLIFDDYYIHKCRGDELLFMRGGKVVRRASREDDRQMFKRMHPFTVP